MAVRLKDPNGAISRLVTDGIAYLWQEYQGTLGRGPDPDGLAAWLNQLLFGGLDQAAVHQAFVDSQEYRDKHPPIPPKPPVAARTGIVRANGRLWADDGGPFFPLGGTLFWAVRGMKYEPDRLAKNLGWFRDHRFDYVRILGEVGWAGNEIDPRWPDYPDVLAKTIDLAYDEFGQRVELTLVGGGIGSGYDYLDLASKVAAVVRDRPAKVIGLEVTNENQIRNDAKRSQVLAYLRAHLPNLVAVTDAGNAGLAEVAGTLAFFQAGATYGTLHLQRDCTKVERAIRPIRQSWDLRDVGRTLAANEPIGPLSSVASDSDPMRLAFNRAVGILNGLGAWVLHNGAGVAGQVDKLHGRPANVWETPGIDRIGNVVRGVDQWLPADLPNWRHYNHGWPGEPAHADSIWTDRDTKAPNGQPAYDPNHGVVRNYQARSGNRWVAFPLGIKDHVDVRVADRSDVRVIDLAGDGVIEQRRVQAGEVIRLAPHGRPTTNRDDPEAWGCLLVTGEAV